MQNAIEMNGITIARTPGGLGIDLRSLKDCEGAVKIEVDCYGSRVRDEVVAPSRVPMWRDFIKGVDMLACGIRVKDGDETLAELPEPVGAMLPFMKLQGDQVHITEHYVSVPPALTITDEVGAVWTLGFVQAPEHKSPNGEFAFDILRDGVPTGEIGSRIERRNGRVRIFTVDGWKRWTGTTFV